MSFFFLILHLIIIILFICFYGWKSTQNIINVVGTICGLGWSVDGFIHRDLTRFLCSPALINRFDFLLDWLNRLWVDDRGIRVHHEGGMLSLVIHSIWVFRLVLWNLNRITLIDTFYIYKVWVSSLQFIHFLSRILKHVHYPIWF